MNSIRCCQQLELVISVPLEDSVTKQLIVWNWLKNGGVWYALIQFHRTECKKIGASRKWWGQSILPQHASDIWKINYSFCQRQNLIKISNDTTFKRRHSIISHPLILHLLWWKERKNRSNNMAALMMICTNFRVGCLLQSINHIEVCVYLITYRKKSRWKSTKFIFGHWIVDTYQYTDYVSDI